MTKRRESPRIVDVVELRKAGKTIPQICGVLGTTIHAVRKVLDAENMSDSYADDQEVTRDDAARWCREHAADLRRHHAHMEVRA